MTIELPPWLGVTVMLLVCGAALWKGGSEERLTGAGLIANAAATVLLRDPSWPNVQMGAFVADALMLVLLLGVSLRTRKYWPLAAAGFMLLNVMTHVAKLLDPNLHQWAYLTAIVVWTYLIYAALGVGVWNTWRGRRQVEKDGAFAGATRR